MYQLAAMGEGRYEEENERTAKQIREAKIEEEEKETGGVRGLVLKVTDVGLIPIVSYENTPPPPQPRQEPVTSEFPSIS